MKRLFDILVSICGLVILSPLLLVIAIAIFVSTSGPIFYKTTRVGKYGKHFKLFKFRSMVVNADIIGPKITGADDPRITYVGQFLRSTKLDELPQLLNVLYGDMSIVGPRPEDPHYVAKYTDEQRQLLNLRPGITSPASVLYRDEESMLTGNEWETYYVNHIMPAKIAVDLDYFQDSSMMSDMSIIFNTLKAIVP